MHAPVEVGVLLRIEVDVFFQCYGFSEGFADDDVPVDSGVGEDDVVEGSEFFVADAVVFNDCIDWEGALRLMSAPPSRKRCSSFASPM